MQAWAIEERRPLASLIALLIEDAAERRRVERERAA